jgi:hypothetical protein
VSGRLKPSQPKRLQYLSLHVQRGSFPVGPCARRSDVHEEASVKTGARRLRDFPDIHSALSAWAGAMKGYAVAPIPCRGVAMRHVGPRDATPVPLSISTWTASSPSCRCAPDRSLSGDRPIYKNTMISSNEHLYGRYRERLAGGAGGGKERPCAPARRRRHPDRMSVRRQAPISSGIRGSPPPSGPEARWGHWRFGSTHSKALLPERI